MAAAEKTTQSPWLPRQELAQCAGRAQRDATHRSRRLGGEQHGTIAEEVIGQLARLVMEANDRNCTTT